MRFEDVIQFWFGKLKPKQWFVKDKKLDEEIRSRFGTVHTRAEAGGLGEWRASPAGRLAEVLVLDQFSRNIFRDHPRAFASDPLALRLAEEAVAVGDDRKLPLERRVFFYMPYMHSESKEVHERAVQLFTVPGLEYSLDFELRHKAIIDRFGRYPHRNAILGRASTPEEIEFLQQPGSGF